MTTGNQDENDEGKTVASTRADNTSNPGQNPSPEIYLHVLTTNSSTGDEEDDIAEAVLLSPILLPEVDDESAASDLAQQNLPHAAFAGSAISQDNLNLPPQRHSTGRWGSHMEVYEKLPPDRQRFAEIGGAVGSVVLGAWSIAAAFLTPWSIFNSIMAILLGVWGMFSPRRNWALLGIFLALIGFFICIVQILSSDWSFLFPATEENDFDF